MNKWLGVYGYKFKDTILNAVASISTNLGLAQHVAAHKSVVNTRRYTKLIAIADTLKVVGKLVVPFLHRRFGAY